MSLVDAGMPVFIPEDIASKEPVLLSQGAEALVIHTNNDEVVKFRPSKTWRLPELDKQLRKRRTAQEVRVIEKLARNGVNVPKVTRSDHAKGLIYMEYINGISLKKLTWDLGANEEVKKMYQMYGEAIAQMHNLKICHGDLTTSNVMVRDNLIVLIDFGLSSQEADVEDKAVDLYVLERAIQSTHPLDANMLVNEIVMPAYERRAEELKDKFLSDVLVRLGQVRQRGRKRTQLG